MNAEDDNRIRELEAELERKDRIIAALMRRVERAVDDAGDSFSLFERNAALESTARERMVQLEQANHRLTDSEERLRRVFDNVQEILFETDGERRIVMLNPAWERITGIPAARCLGRDWIEILHPEDRDKGLARCAPFMEGSTADCTETLRITCEDGSVRWMDVRMARSTDRDGNTVGTIGTMADVTRQHEAVEQIRQAREAAEAANQAKSAFLANMSHELRTPLNAIIGYAEILSEEAGDAGVGELAGDADKIISAGRHLLSLINDILDISKIEAGRMDLYLEDFGLAPEIDQVLATVRPLVESRGNELRLENGTRHETIHADLTKLRQILFNLLSNAAKFTEHGEIRLTVRDGEDGALEFEIRDTGIGITEEQLARLFQPFTQADASTTRKYGGTGLGLSLSRHFARMMGGDIDVSSEPGEGSTFVVRLPLQGEAPDAGRDASGSAAVAPPSARSCRPGHVLVIDDDASVRDLIRRSLATEGYEVTLATGGEEGLRLAREQRPDLITLDVMMPAMDGWAVMTALKNDPDTRDIPVIMLSMLRDRDMGFMLGAADYVTKPVERHYLLEAVGRQMPPPCAWGATPETCERSPGCGCTCTVLVVEDDAETREMIRRQLDCEGSRVIEAEDGQSGLRRLEERDGRVDLILLDLMLPGMDGFAFLDQLQRHERWGEIPVLVLTARDLSAAERGRLLERVEDIFQKGAVSREDLLAAIHSHVDRHASASNTDLGQ
ncbi:response regulator [Thioalkalivibrio sp. ALgr3]|uniref:hybrid sensor histidine kinase/response regulator n=1 Tax=Thioalkalivibrio sp. ALgr3 TaxID=1239292 RepID=UPI00037EB191|nr:response regulator [Thioalkalivibrio sp. ALgr3]